MGGRLIVKKLNDKTSIKNTSYCLAKNQGSGTCSLKIEGQGAIIFLEPSESIVLINAPFCPTSFNIEATHETSVNDVVLIYTQQPDAPQEKRSKKMLF